MNLSAFDLNLLRVLDALLREGSTVRAGARIGLSQPAVSAALGRLRHALGDPLFVREGQGLVPTDFARGLELPLAEILDRLTAILSGPELFDPAKAQGTIRLSGSDFFGMFLMPPLMAHVGRVAPGLRLRLDDLIYEQSPEAIRSDEVDIAILPQTGFPEWTEEQPVFWSSYVLVARAGHPRIGGAGIGPGMPVPLDLYCEIPQVAFAPGQNWVWREDAALERLGRSRRVVLTVRFFSGVWQAAAGSDLIAVLPRRLAEAVAPQAGLSVHPLPFEMPRTLLTMLWHRRSSANPAHRWLRGVIAELLLEQNRGEPPLPPAPRREG